ncbi:MAG: hypothetical protein L6R42_010286 [Xanthoria sp. 1 TBL-2021]|nr:MAG: hypothetical protein L6R42_010286 [Xanthoria sp. 1 TBL-2021]
MKGLIADVIAGRKVIDDNVENQEWCMSVVAEGRKQLTEAEKTVEQQKSTIANLEERLKGAESSPAAGVKEEQEQQGVKPPSPTATDLQSLQTENTNLNRELRLMSSAFHNLAARHQYTGMTVQRKSETPSSWLGKQRRIVEGNLGVGGRR